MSFEDATTMNRRLLLQRALVLVGSTAVLSACAAVPSALSMTADPSAPFALTDAQRATLTALSDTIIPVTDTPGALAAGVPAQIEVMLRDWAAPENRAEMVAGLARVEALGGGFAALSAERRHELLLPHDAAALVVIRPGAQGLAGLLAGPVRQDQGYSKLRDLVITLYYYSETALTQELEWNAIPGHWDPSVPLTENSHAISNGISNY